MRRLVAHLVLVVVGLAAVLWALMLGAHPTITCRDQVMVPGGVCSNAQGSRVQTYEERLTAHHQARPVIAGAGVLVAAFGGGLALTEARRLRRADSWARTRSDRRT